MVDCLSGTQGDINYFGCVVGGELWPEFQYSSSELELVARHSSWKAPVHVGDPYSGVKGTFVGNTTIQKELLNNHGIRVALNRGSNSVTERISITTLLLKRLRVHRRCAVKDGAWARIMAARWPRERGGEKSGVSRKKPVHDITSHYRTALEYGAEYLSGYRVSQKRRPPHRPKRPSGYQDDYRGILR
jgi:hypothetical protein